MARPRIEIAWDEFDKLCAIQCTLAEMASWFDCSEGTIENAVKREKKLRFCDYWEQKAGKGKISLRRQQWNLAMKGDKTMLIWLGKQYLGQNERMQLMLSNLTDEQLAQENTRRLHAAESQKNPDPVQSVAGTFPASIQPGNILIQAATRSSP